MAKLIFEGRHISTVPFSATPRGPLLNLPAIAAVLGVDIVVGPLGDSHRLILKDKEVIVGPERAVTVIVAKEKGRAEEIRTFQQAPIKTALGLEVPLELVADILGDEAGIDFAWDAEALELRLARRQVRMLEVFVDVFHQHSSTVEIRFSAVPRYRIERSADAVEIRLVGDRIELPVDTARARSELVGGIVVDSDRLRVTLAPGAGAAEPRLIEEGGARLVIDVFRQATRGTLGTEGDFELKPGVRTVVIDPGHGGTESGAVGPNGSEEKNLSLMIARSLQRLLERRLRLRVVLTRDDDVYVPLETRTAVANQNQADLFISLHFNSYLGISAHGAETYFLSREASDRVAAEVAATENQAGGDEADPESALQLILWDLAQSYHLAESQRFASLVQEELNLTLGLRDRGVKQAPFRVLTGATMPAVLVELGFISNPEEEAQLQSPIYQADLVDSLFRAVRRFKTQMETRENGDTYPPEEVHAPTGGRAAGGGAR
jgi:N-acetylmuramoyl-L-alanine amidase